MTTLPLYRRGSGPEDGGWREMACDNDALATRVRVFSFLRLKPFRSVSRLTLFVLGGAFFCLWYLLTQVGPPSFLGRPRPPPPFGVGPPPFGYDEDDGFAPAKKPSIDWQMRAEKVKEAFLHAYHGYEQYASPADELLPLSNSSINNFNGWGVTTVDSLDTMYLMGLHDEFDRGVKLVEMMRFDKDNTISVPFFETVIRYLGGLLSAYALSHDAVLLRRADELGAALLPAFDTPSGLPAFAVNPVTGEHSSGGIPTGWLAEIASCMMEYKYLAKLTGRKEYYEAADTVMRRMYDANLTTYPDGLLPTLWNLSTGEPINDIIAIGAMADSAYEYFLKQYLLTNQTEPESLALYLRTMRGILDHNLYLSPMRSLLYVTGVSAKHGTPSRIFEHLSCFLPGLLALGASRLPPSAFVPYSDFVDSDTTPSELQRHVWAATGLAVACGTMYSDMPTGLGADEIVFLSATDIERARLMRERVEEMERKKVEEKAKAAMEKEKAMKGEVGERSPPVLPNDGFGSRPKPNPINQTAEDEKLRWANVLSAWREGLYDGTSNEYLSVEGVSYDGGHDRHGEVVKMGHVRKGPVPGLRDPPPEASLTSELREYRPRNPSYQLRPETIESFFILWRTTGNEAWRTRGWAAFEAIEKHLRTQSGYATIRNVFSERPSLTNSMPSFFLAETLKYLYLLFSDESLLPLDKYVLNTEAHPFPVFEWTEWEKTKFGIRS